MRAGWIVAFVVGVLLGAGAMHLLGSGGDGAGEGMAAEQSSVATSDEPTLETRPAEVIARLRAERDTARRRIVELEAEVSSHRATLAQADKTAKASPAKASASGTGKPAIPEKLWPVAEEIGASRAAVEAAWKIRSGDYEDRDAAVAALKALGHDGLLGVATLCVTRGTGHTMLPPLIGELGVDGGDDTLIKLIEENEHPGGLVVALGEYDTKRSRDFLVEYLPSLEENPGLYWYATQALSKLKEPRGAEMVRIDTITQKRWGGVRGHILWHLGEMGGAQAARRLSDYLQMEGADCLGTAVRALAKIDEEAARRHARRILSSDRARFLSYLDRPALEKLAKQKQD